MNSFVTPAKSQALADVICEFINTEKVPAIQVTVIDSLGDEWTLTTGTADIKRKVSADDDNLFRLASITKTFTATVIFRLIELGQLSPDDKLISYFPEYKNAPDVTIRNLLTHSSGIKELLMLPDILTTSTLFTTKVWDIRYIVNTISKKDLVFPTGTDFQYSNTNYVLLGLIAEKRTGKKITNLYNEIIFDPLNLNSIFLVPQEETPAALLSGYDRELLPTPGIYEVTRENSAWASAAFTSGALVGNSLETAQFFHNLLTGKILTQSSLGLMETFGEKKEPDNEFQKYFGAGLFRFEMNGNNYYGHEGLFIGADNIACFRTSDKVSIVILANISTYKKFELLEAIDSIL